MSTAATIPVFDPQGVLRDIPEASLADAVKAGGKPAVKFQAPDKSIRYVPADKTQDAVKAGGTLMPFEQQNVKHPGFWSSMASDLVGMAHGVAQTGSAAFQAMGGNPLPMAAQAADTAQGVSDNMQHRKDQGRSLAYRTVAPVGDALGVNTRGMEDAADQGNVAGVMGHAAAVPAAMAITAGAPKAAGAVEGPLAKSVRVAVRSANIALEKAPGTVGGAVGATVGGYLGGHVGAEVGGAAGALAGRELLPQVRLPGEGFGLPDRVMGGPAVAPGYQPVAEPSPAFGPTRTLPGQIAPESIYLSRAQSIPARSGLMLPAPAQRPVFPGATLPAVPDRTLIQGNSLMRGTQPVVDPAAGLGQIKVAALQQAAQELGPKAPVASIAARAKEIQSALNKSLNVQELKPNVPLKDQLFAAPGAAEVKSTTRSARGFEGGGASELPEAQPKPTPPPGESTAVDSFKYDADKQEIHVTGKNGRTYVYGEVTPEQAQMFHEAESKGMAWKAIKDNNPYVAKIIDGKRIAIKKAATSASPDDLTSQLEESLKQALSKRGNDK